MLRAVGVRAASQARRQFATAAVATGDLETAVTRAGQRLQMALDAVDFIHDSASQLMLETDPSNRQPREFYVVRYQRFALQELLRSLERVEEIRSKHPDVADKLLAAGNLHIVMADSKLARDKLQHAVISAESRAVTGLYAH